MKIFSVRSSASGARLVTGSDTPKKTDGTNAPKVRGLDLTGGVAVSVLPAPYQRRLQKGERIESGELDDLTISVVR